MTGLSCPQCGKRFCDCHKKQTTDYSYIFNCLIKSRDDQVGPMFEFKTGKCDVVVRLDGYAVIPIEEYEKLTGEEYRSGCDGPSKPEPYVEEDG